MSNLKDRQWVTIVSGLPRSGTSLMMQMLQAGGFSLCTDGARMADESNPRGYFEFESVKNLRTDHSWLPQAQGRAVKVIHALVRLLPVGDAFHYRVLMMKRPIEEVLASQQAMLQRQGKTSADEATLSRVFQSQLADLEKWLAGQTGFSYLPVDYHSVLAEPLRVSERISTFLGGHLDAAAMASVVAPELYRQRQAGTRSQA